MRNCSRKIDDETKRKCTSLVAANRKIKKVYQRIIDKDRGDCMRAALATLFGVTYEEMPYLELKNYFPALWQFLEERGLEWGGYLWNPNGNGILENYSLARLPEYPGVNGLFWASVYSPKYGKPNTHAVLVDKNCNVIHDPNPENQGLAKYPLADEMGFNGVQHVVLIAPKTLKGRKNGKASSMNKPEK